MPSVSSCGAGRWRRHEEWDTMHKDGTSRAPPGTWEGLVGEGVRPVLSQLASNLLLRTSLIAWATAQLLKFSLGWLIRRRPNPSLLISTGGMPSSHTAFVSALAVGAGKLAGFDSALFAVAFVFAAVVVYDATGVRQAVGRQAEVLNRIIEDLYHGRAVRPDRLRELLGHTPVEAMAGAAIGISIAILLT